MFQSNQKVVITPNITVQLQPFNMKLVNIEQQQRRNRYLLVSIYLTNTNVPGCIIAA